MNIDFTPAEIVMIYGHYRLEAKDLEALIAAPNHKIDKKDLNKQIKFLAALTDNIETAYPRIRDIPF